MLSDKLTIGLTYKGTVQQITPCSRGYTGKNGKEYHCHDVILAVDGFPGGFYTSQICNLKKGIEEFEVGSYIQFKVDGHFVADDKYTIKYENHAFKTVPRKEVIGAQKPDVEITKGESHNSERKYESSIAGTPWSICLTAAKDFHKDRKTSNDNDVIATLKVYLQSYNEYLVNPDYLKI